MTKHGTTTVSDFISCSAELVTFKMLVLVCGWMLLPLIQSSQELRQRQRRRQRANRCLRECPLCWLGCQNHQPPWRPQRRLFPGRLYTPHSAPHHRPEHPPPPPKHQPLPRSYISPFCSTQISWNPVLSKHQKNRIDTSQSVWFHPECFTSCGGMEILNEGGVKNRAPPNPDWAWICK